MLRVFNKFLRKRREKRVLRLNTLIDFTTGLIKHCDDSEWGREQEALLSGHRQAYALERADLLDKLAQE